MIKKIILLFALLSAAAFAGPVLTLQGPNPASGAPGTQTGWGFSLSNDTSSYLVVSSVTASPGLLVFGVFQEFIATNFVVVSPTSTLLQAFFSDGGAGFGSLNISNGATPGSYSEFFTVTYDLYVNDPHSFSFSPHSNDQYGLVLSPVNASLNITGAGGSVPEPSTFALLGLGAVGLGLVRRRRKACRAS